ncbi:MAG: insulinase family protein, partial [Niameybacter sp.]
WIENKDTNKSFTLGVKTPTTDNTGVNHIIEHTLFTGSKKYPSSTLFFDASSKYPNLFMNAMTSSDMTVFHFATSHDACFDTLLSIYLDCILNPNMTVNPSSFYEEAFHYNPLTKQYGGVVYNEMKGANGDRNRQVFRAIRQGLYEGTHYANDSGGNPDSIPELSYEKFIETYKGYYYPSNMMIILYGDLPIGHVLGLIDEAFQDIPLSDKQIDVNVKPDVVSKEKTLYFNESGTNGYLIKSFVVEKDLTSNEMLEMDLWVSTYLVDEQSYFMKTLKRQGLTNVQVIKDSYVKYPSYSIVIGNVTKENMASEKVLLEKVLESLATKKIDQETERNIIAKNQLVACSEDLSPTRGIEIAEAYLDAWAHDKVGAYYFSDKAHIDELTKLPESYRSLLLGSPSMYIQLLPKEEAPLASHADQDKSWGERLEKMTIWQKETKHLPLPDISFKDLLIHQTAPYKIVEKDDMKYVLTENDGPLKGVSLYIPTGHIQQEELPYLFLYSQLLKKAAQEKTPFEAIMDVDVVAVGSDCVTPYLKVSMLSNKDFDSLSMLEQAKASLQAKEVDWFDEQLQIFLSQFKENFSQDMLGTLKWLNASGQKGYKRYLFEQHYPLYTQVRKMRRSGEVDYVKAIKEMGNQLEYAKDMMIGIQGNKTFRESELERLETYFEGKTLPVLTKANYDFTKYAPLNIYYRNTPVDYLVFSYDKEEDLIEGSDYVMASYMTNQYLRPVLRAEHGAYGSSMFAKYPSSLIVYTYRDPNFLESVEGIQEASNILRKDLNEEALKVAKLDALAEYQRQMSLVGDAFEKGNFIESCILRGTKPETLLKLQKEILDTKLSALDEKFSLLPYLLGNGQLGICTGNKQLKVQKQVNIYRER